MIGVCKNKYTRYFIWLSVYSALNKQKWASGTGNVYKEIKDMTFLILSIKTVLNFPQETSWYMMIFSPSDGLETDVFCFCFFVVVVAIPSA